MARLAAQDVVLVGWHEFTGDQVHKFLNSAKPSDTSLTDVSGLIYGGNGSRAWGSTDGTYGPSEAVGTSAKDGTMSLKIDTVNNSKLYFTVENNTAGNLVLSSIAFDFASVNNNSPQNLTLYYHNGDLTDADATVVHSMTNILNGLGANSDYEDELISLSVLGDQSLAPGESATFRFDVDTATNSTQAMSVDNIAILGYAASADLRVVTYNMHGGEGPNGEGDATSNLTAFRDDFMQGEDILCLQEVGAGYNIEDEWAAVLAVFPEAEDPEADANTNANVYPYRYRTINENSGNFNRTACAILSKYPIVSTHNKLIQEDPQGDFWERHAQHVQIQLGANIIDVFNFHNTYNFFDNDFESEKEGLTKFRDYVYERLGITSLANGGNLLMLGDFNVLQANVIAILPTPARRSNGLDHVSSVPLFVSAGAYATSGSGASLSDHNAVWATLDVQAPSPDAMTWAATPASSNTGTIAMTATTAVDSNAVEYYFTNTTVADGSHDSGWQSSTTYVDTRLDEGVSYAYTVMARDKSANANVTSASASASATSTIEYIAPPYKEGFENGFGNWLQVTDDNFDWTRHSGGTATGATGPSGASDGSWYLYIEPNDVYSVHNKVAEIDCRFDLSSVSAAGLSFDYHMYGTNVDYLAVDVYDGTTWFTNIWKRTNAQHASSDDPWSNAVVDLSGYSGNDTVIVRFRAKQKYWHVSDIAIDDICIDELSTILYAQWEAVTFAAAPNGTDTSSTGNPDMDDQDNEGEWIFGTDPLTMDSPIKEMTHDSTDMSFDYTRRKSTGRNVFAQWSPDLTPLSWGTSDLIEEVSADDGEVETVTVTVPMDTDKKFVRVRAE